MSVQALMAAVEEFHNKHAVPYGDYRNAGMNPRIANAAITCKSLAQQFEKYGGIEEDPFALRAHLMLEELGEFLTAVVDGDHVEMHDGLCDLLYVVVGTAVQLRMTAFPDCFDEVCSSNMTKEVGDTARVRGKGDSYRPPNIEGILRATVSDS